MPTANSAVSEPDQRALHHDAERRVPEDVGDVDEDDRRHREREPLEAVLGGAVEHDERGDRDQADHLLDPVPRLGDPEHDRAPGLPIASAETVTSWRAACRVTSSSPHLLGVGALGERCRGAHPSRSPQTAGSRVGARRSRHGAQRTNCARSTQESGVGPGEIAQLTRFAPLLCAQCPTRTLRWSARACGSRRSASRRCGSGRPPGSPTRTCSPPTRPTPRR